MIKIFLLDDDIKYLNYVREKIIDFSIRHNENIKVVCYNTFPEIIEENFDAFFLDIEINENTSFEFAKNIKIKFPDTPLVFFTNHNSYINQSVKFYIFDFIRKSYFDTEFESTLIRLISYINSKNDEIVININHTLEKIKLQSIIYIEAYSHNCIIHSSKGEFLVPKGVKSTFGHTLDKYIKIHKSYYVNMKYACSYSSQELMLIDNIRLPISKNCRRTVKEAFIMNTSHSLY